MAAIMSWSQCVANFLDEGQISIAEYIYLSN